MFPTGILSVAGRPMIASAPVETQKFAAIDMGSGRFHWKSRANLRQEGIAKFRETTVVDPESDFPD
jgi:hypothetical protein